MLRLWSGIWRRALLSIADMPGWTSSIRVSPIFQLPVKWLTDHTRPFALVLVQADTVTDTPLGHFGHLGIACATREEIDRKTAMAAKEGVLRKAPEDLGDPVGYYVFFADPDGNTLELSYGQRVGITAIQAK